MRAGCGGWRQPRVRWLKPPATGAGVLLCVSLGTDGVRGTNGPHLGWAAECRLLDLTGSHLPPWAQIPVSGTWNGIHLQKN